MKRLILFFAILSITFLGFCQTNLMDLKGKKIIIPPNIKVQQGSFYTLDVLRKMKFEDKYSYNEIIFGDTLSVTDVQHLNIGDKKKEFVLLHLIHKDKEIIFFLPLYINNNDNRVYRSFYADLTRDTGVFTVNQMADYKKIVFPYYDVDVLNIIKDKWLNHILYPRKTECGKVFNYNLERFETERLNELEPYLFLGFEFLPEDPQNDNFESLYAIFSSRNGNKIYYPIFASSHYISRGQIYTDNYHCTLDKLEAAFYSDTELKDYCEANKNISLLDSIRANYVGQEVFIDKQVLENSCSELPYNIDKGNLTNWGDGYFIITGIKMLPSIRKKPFYHYFAIASNNEGEFAIPIEPGFSTFVVDVSTHRSELQNQAMQEEQKRLDREAKYAREEKEYKSTLTRKYGSSNAQLILDGSIRLGFTKAMVMEAWGSPYDTMTVSNNLGSVECWIYGIGSYVYFRGNKVVQIIN